MSERHGPGRRAAIGLTPAVALVLVACAPSPSQGAPSAAASSAPASVAVAPTPSYRTLQPQPTPTPTPRLPDLTGDHRNAIAFAPLDHPNRVTVVGDVTTDNAWSTSKVLVAAAFVREVAGGDPRNLDTYQRNLVKRALTASDMDALLAMRGQIPGGSGAPMTEILRSIGDHRTTAPNSSEGSMSWSLRNQVRFMAALNDGKVVNNRTSRYLLHTMNPIPKHSWGLGRIGAVHFKGGWLEPYTETRQMGIVDGYAVAIITTAGPAVLQSDGDYAHVRAITRLAHKLRKYLDADAAQHS